MEMRAAHYNQQQDELRDRERLIRDQQQDELRDRERLIREEIQEERDASRFRLRQLSGVVRDGHRLQYIPGSQHTTHNTPWLTTKHLHTTLHPEPPDIEQQEQQEHIEQQQHTTVLGSTCLLAAAACSLAFTLRLSIALKHRKSGQE